MWQLAKVVVLAEDAKSKKLPQMIKMLDLGKQCNVRLSKDRWQPSEISEERGAGTYTKERRV